MKEAPVGQSSDCQGHFADLSVFGSIMNFFKKKSFFFKRSTQKIGKNLGETPKPFRGRAHIA